MPKKPKTAKIKSEVKELALLFEISQILDLSRDIRDEVHPVLQAMARQMGILRGVLTLLNRETEEIFIEAAYGLSDSDQKKGKYKLGEGITGKVIQTGEAAMVPRISKDPLFLHRTGRRKLPKKKDISFICVPIKIENKVIGALSTDQLFDDSVDYKEDLRLLTIIASMIAQAVKSRQALQEEQAQLVEENIRLQEELKDKFRPTNIIGNSKAMHLIYDLIGQVMKSDATVLLRGESGTGKELAAHAIHYNSPRSDMPFIKVNCAALPETIIESELFGHEKGAFTGAVNARKGRFEMADQGTIFLDEIGDLSPSTQIKLLRALQEREFERVGGMETIAVNVRVITATNRNLEDLVAVEKFRSDLYYRINVFPIHLPPLRDRRTDIPLLADFFVERYSRKNHKDIRRISTPAIDMLMSYHWPGNVRELENCIERAVLVSNDDVIHGHHLPPSLQTAEASGTRFVGSLQATIDNVERELLIDALKSARGNMTRASQELGITDRTMGLRIKKHGIEPKRFRSKG